MFFFCFSPISISAASDSFPLLLISSRTICTFLSVVGCLHFISLHVYLLWFCLALLCFLLWHDVYCWVHARNQYSILIVLYGEFVIIAYTTIPHITASYTPMLFWTLVVRAVSIAVCLFFSSLFYAIFPGVDMWFLFFFFIILFQSFRCVLASPNHLF